MCLSLGADIRLAGESAVFCGAGISNGLTGTELGVSWLLPRAVGNLPRVRDPAHRQEGRGRRGAPDRHGVPGAAGRRAARTRRRYGRGHVRLQPVRPDPDQGHHVGGHGGGQPRGPPWTSRTGPSCWPDTPGTSTRPRRPSRRSDLPSTPSSEAGPSMAKARRGGKRSRPAAESLPRPAPGGSTGGPTAGRRPASPPRTRPTGPPSSLRLDQGADLDPYRCGILRGLAPGESHGRPTDCTVRTV